MQSITNTVELKNAIRLLETEHSVKQQLLIEQFHVTYESLKPVNLLRRTIKDISASPDLLDSLINSSIGFASGYLSKKLFVGSSDSTFKKVMGSLLQVGVSSLATRYSDTIKSVILTLFNYIMPARNFEESGSKTE